MFSFLIPVFLLVNYYISILTIFQPMQDKFSLLFDVASEGSKVGVGKDVGMLGQDVGSIGLEGLLPDCPVSHRPQHSVLEENVERGQRGQKQSVCTHRALEGLVRLW